jgi:hypothetical protein
MKLNPKQKFILPDDDGNLILITELDFEYSSLQNRIIFMKGVNIDINLENNEISTGDKVDIQANLDIENIEESEDK